MQLIKLILVSSLLFFSLHSFGQPQFICDDTPYLVSYANDDKKLFALDFDWENGEVSLNPLPGTLLFSKVTAIGYSKEDNYIYGIAQEDSLHIFLRIDAVGDAHILDTLDFEGIWDRVENGSVSPIDNKFYFYLFDADFAPEAPSSALGVIDLNTSSFDMSIIPFVHRIGYHAIWTGGSSFDPVTDSFFVYLNFGVSEERLGYVNRSLGPFLDTTAFPLNTSGSFIIEGLFFDSYTRLWGVGYNEMNKLDKQTGVVETIITGTYPQPYDVCSCPYTVGLQNKVSRDTAFACTEVTYTIVISNLSKNTLMDISFEDVFPDGFEITEVLRNPYGGTVSGLQSSGLTISGMTIPFGIDSIELSVLLPADTTGLFYNQASLANLDLSSGNNPITFLQSDDPRTDAKPDSTPIYITTLDLDLVDNSYELCQDSSLTLNPFPFYEELEYQWQDGSGSNTYTVESPGDYSLTVTAGCKSDSGYFEVLPSVLAVDLGVEEEIIYGDTIELNADYISASAILSYWWEIPDTVFCSVCPSVVIKPSSDIEIKLTIENEATCVATAYKQIRVAKDVYVPNAFSPNGDGVNDYFYIQSKNPIAVLRLSVFSRWGELVYEKKDGATNIPEEGWDGLFNNEAVASGVYLWYAELEYSNGERELLKGDISILSGNR